MRRKSVPPAGSSRIVRIKVDFCRNLCYDDFAVGASAVKEVNRMEYVFTLMVSVAANVITYFVCKWLDGHR